MDSGSDTNLFATDERGASRAPLVTIDDEYCYAAKHANVESLERISVGDKQSDGSESIVSYHGRSDSACV